SLGYLNDEKLNKEKYKVLENTGERIYRTGDVGYYLPNGDIIFCGRENGDSQVKIHGHRIELSEIKSILLENTNIESAE
ncbi:AMP-binding protein, partial [Enterococcus faecalis]